MYMHIYIYIMIYDIFLYMWWWSVARSPRLGRSPSHGGHLKCAPSPGLMLTGTEGGAPSKLRCLSTKPCRQFPRESGGCLRQP